MDDALLSRVKQAVDDLDPEGLLALGAPNDEYMAEAQDFARRLDRGQSFTPDLVAEIWIAWFYPDCGLVRKELAAALAGRLNALRR